MTTEITVQSSKLATLPAVATLANALRAIELETGVGGVTIIKMDKTGHWVFGADQTEVEEDSTWGINPFSFVHGFIAWGDGEVLAEKMTPVTEPLPELEAAPPGAKKGWESQIGLSVKCLTGTDAGLEARYTTTSVGGKRAVQELGAKIATQVEQDETKPVPVVRLDSDHYKHKDYGKIYTPIFEVIDWVALDGAPKSAVAAIAEAPAEPVEETGRRRRRG